MSTQDPSDRGEPGVPVPSRLRLVVEGIGLAGVILSLVFVGFEIRQNTVAMRSATQQAIFETSIAANMNVMNNERLRELLVRTEDEPDWIATAPRDADYMLLKRFHQNRFNDLENAYFHFLQGTYDPRLWAGQEGWIGIIAEEPAMSHFWAELREAYFREFRSYMDSVMAR